MQINTDNIAQQCLNAINDRIHNLKRLNIIVIGKSGVGKSTLINSLFRGNFADTGLGRPVTQEIRKIEKTGYPLAIYDTPGFELSYTQQESVKDEVIKLINNGYSSNDINEVITAFGIVLMSVQTVLLIVRKWNGSESFLRRIKRLRYQSLLSLLNLYLRRKH